jgi:hypothetical protein
VIQHHANISTGHSNAGKNESVGASRKRVMNLIFYYSSDDASYRKFPLEANMAIDGHGDFYEN